MMNPLQPFAGSSSVAPIARVGRLVPLPGVVPRAHPDRHQVSQFLLELAVPILASQSVLEQVAAEDVSERVCMAVATVRNQNDYLQRLVAEFAEYGELEQGKVPVAAAVWELQPWLDSVLAGQQRKAQAEGMELRINYRGLLPSHVVLDAGLVARALAATLHVALHRSLRGPVDLAIVFEEGSKASGSSMLHVEISTLGGAFCDLEQGYVFAPFYVRDAASRPLLGLSLAQRFAELLGGELAVESLGSRRCSYSLRVVAEPAPDAVWLDPVGRGVPLGQMRSC